MAEPAAGVAISAASGGDRRPPYRRRLHQFIIIEDAPDVDSPPSCASATPTGRGRCRGNATRCIGATGRSRRRRGRARTGADLLTKRAGYELSVDMGIPRGDWEIIWRQRTFISILPADRWKTRGGQHGQPMQLRRRCRLYTYRLVGPELEVHPVFPERANNIAQILALIACDFASGGGVGLTSACGTGACAAVVNANRRNLPAGAWWSLSTGRTRSWREDRPGEPGRVFMTGPAATSPARRRKPARMSATDILTFGCRLNG